VLPGTAWHVFFLWEIDLRFEKGRCLDESGPPNRRLASEYAFRLAESGAALPFSLGVDKIGEAFDRAKIHFAVRHRAAGEFPWLGGPGARDAAYGFDHSGHDGAAAMDMELRIVLARKTFGAGEKNHKSLVDGLARGGIAEGCEHGYAGFWQAPGYAVHNEPRGRSRESQNCDRGAPRARGNGKDRDSIHCRGFTVLFWHRALVDHDMSIFDT
jgi:hypothetical protein